MTENPDRIALALGLLEKFNRKERYHLLRDAVVGDPFELSDSFVKKINATLDYPIPKNEKVYVAMDYHLDWIASVVHLIDYKESVARSVYRGKEIPKSLDIPANHLHEEKQDRNQDPKMNQIVTGNQADVDLLVAFRREETLVLVMIEAKLESGWDGSQLVKKGERLREIFGDRFESKWVVPRMVLAGPGADEKAPKFSRETLNGCPAWFFDPETLNGGRENKQLRRVNLVAQHALYQPARTTDDGHEWLIKKTWRGSGSTEE